MNKNVQKEMRTESVSQTSEVLSSFGINHSRMFLLSSLRLYLIEKRQFFVINTYLPVLKTFTKFFVGYQK